MLKILIQDNRIVRIICVLLIVAGAMVLRCARLAQRALWGDELYVHSASDHPVFVWDKSFSEIYELNLKIGQFPGDIIFLWPFHLLFGTNKWGLALPHIAATVFGFYWLYCLCRIYFRTVLGYAAAFLVTALNANLIFHSFELRPYSVLAALALAAFLVMKSLVEDLNPPVKQKVFRCLFIAGTLLFHLYGSLILFFTYFFHMMHSRPAGHLGKIIWSHLRFYGIALLGALPVWAYLAFGFDKTYMAWDPYEYIPKGVVPLLKGVFGNLIGFKPFYVFLGTFVLAFLIPHQERKAQAVFFFVLVLCPIALIFWSCITYKYWFIQRLFVWVMPFFAFLLGWQIDSLITYLLPQKKPNPAKF